MELVAKVSVLRDEIEDESFPEEVSLHSEYSLYAHVMRGEREFLPGFLMLPYVEVEYEVHERCPAEDGSEYVARYEHMKLPALALAFEELAPLALGHYLSVKE